MAIDFTKPKSQKISRDIIINTVITVISITFFLILWNFTVKPKNIKIGNLEKKARAMAAVTDERITTLKQDKNTITATKDSISREVETTKKKFREEINVSMLMDRFARNARKHRLSFNYIKPSTPVTTALSDKGKDAAGFELKMKKIAIELELEAGFFDFLGFLSDTERVDQFLKITELSVETNPANAYAHRERMVLSVYQLLEK